jgi:MarR family transcriptional regulator, organic hydroperoxide resistance regulator
VSKAAPGSGEQAGDLPALGEVLEFMRLLWAVDHGLQKKSKVMAASMGLTGPQRLVIRIAGRFPGISAGQLAAILHVHPSTLTGVLRRLKRRGLLSRRADPKDARRAALGLTRRGRKLDVETVGTIEWAVRGLLTSQPRRRIRATREVLRTLAVSLGVDGRDHPGEIPRRRRS